MIIPAENIEKAYDSVAEEWMALKAMQRMHCNETDIRIQRARAVSSIMTLELVTGHELYYHSGEQKIKHVTVNLGQKKDIQHDLR
jgi:hypothetical protein